MYLTHLERLVGNMGYFAQIQDGTVIQVIAINNEVLGEDTLSFPDTESMGRAFISNTLGLPGEWRQTSFNANFRHHYAGKNFTFNPDMGEHGAFIPPQPYPSWTLDENVNWQPPVPCPTDDKAYVWNEDDQEWQS
jgi:hypothetical protein